MNREDLIVTAQTAQLNLNEAELERLFPVFKQMIEFFSAMQEVDSDKTAFKTSTMDLSETREGVTSGHFRPDIADSPSSTPRDNLIEDLLSNAGERNDRFIVVPNVL